MLLVVVITRWEVVGRGGRGYLQIAAAAFLRGFWIMSGCGG